MKVVVFSSPNNFHTEIPYVIQMFEKGLGTFHLRKPKFSTKDLEEYITSIPERYRGRIIIHTHHELASAYQLKGIHYSRTHRKKGISGKAKFSLSRIINRSMVFSKSCHSLSTIKEDVNKYDYVFLSPVFDSISKDSHKSKFGLGSIKQTLESTKQTVYALGGVDPTKLEKAIIAGFDGVAVLGYIWESGLNPVEAYLNIRNGLRDTEEKLLMSA